MSATMRTTLQTVPESLPADHVTNAAAVPSTSTGVPEIRTHAHNNMVPSKIRTSTTKVCFFYYISLLFFFYLFLICELLPFHFQL